jgi:hypothetical protein
MLVMAAELVWIIQVLSTDATIRHSENPELPLLERTGNANVRVPRSARNLLSASRG